MLSLTRLFLILVSLLFVSPRSYSEEYPYTDVKLCEALSQAMNAQSFSVLFKKPTKIQLKSSRRHNAGYGYGDGGYGGGYNSNGCIIIVKAAPIDPIEKEIYREIGSIVVIHQSNALNLYQQAKQNFANNNHILYQQQSLPYIDEGFIDKTLPNNSTFNAYLKNQYYLIISLNRQTEGNQKSNIKHQTSNINYITPIFMQFINIATQQIANSL